MNFDLLPSRRIHLRRRLLAATAIAALGMPGCAGLSALDKRAQSHVPVVPSGAIVAPEKPMTLPRFLGVDACVRKSVLLCQLTRERLAVVVPALEPKPLALPLSHPANADSPSPAVAGAHKVQKAKAAKAAKIKAVAYLAGEGCLENPHVEEGILAALDDVSAEVRVAGVEAVIESSRRGCESGCQSCSNGCCTDSIRSKLTTMVFEQSAPGCWLEPSSKARRLARLALDLCGGPMQCDSCVETEKFPMEVPPPELIEAITAPAE